MQKRYIGYQDDLTQEALLFQVKANSLPGVKYGLQTSLDAETRILTIQPGYFILPDGMVVGETEALKVQLLEPGTGDYWATLIATRLIEPGMLNDEVLYEIVPNKLAADMLNTIPNRIRMPLTWIHKVGEEFRLYDLGQRTAQITKILAPPFPEIFTTYPRIGYSAGVLYRSFTSIDSPFYLKIPRERDSYISGISITAKGDVPLILNVEAPGTFNVKVNFTKDYTTQILPYTLGSYVAEDVLNFRVDINATISISEIQVFRTRYF